LERLGLESTGAPDFTLQPEQLAAFGGTYSGDGIEVEVVPENGRLSVAVTFFYPLSGENVAYPPFLARPVAEREFEVVDAGWRGAARGSAARARRALRRGARPLRGRHRVMRRARRARRPRSALASPRPARLAAPHRARAAARPRRGRDVAGTGLVPGDAFAGDDHERGRADLRARWRPARDRQPARAAGPRARARAGGRDRGRLGLFGLAAGCAARA